MPLVRAAAALRAYLAERDARLAAAGEQKPAPTPALFVNLQLRELANRPIAGVGAAIAGFLLARLGRPKFRSTKMGLSPLCRPPAQAASPLDTATPAR